MPVTGGHPSWAQFQDIFNNPLLLVLLHSLTRPCWRWSCTVTHFSALQRPWSFESAAKCTALTASLLLHLKSAATQTLPSSTDPLPGTWSAGVWLKSHCIPLGKECKNQRDGEVSQSYSVLKVEPFLGDSRVKMKFRSGDTLSQGCWRTETEHSALHEDFTWVSSLKRRNSSSVKSLRSSNVFLCPQHSVIFMETPETTINSLKACSIGLF